MKTKLLILALLSLPHLASALSCGVDKDKNTVNFNRYLLGGFYVPIQHSIKQEVQHHTMTDSDNSPYAHATKTTIYDNNGNILEETYQKNYDENKKIAITIDLKKTQQGWHEKKIITDEGYSATYSTDYFVDKQGRIDRVKIIEKDSDKKSPTIHNKTYQYDDNNCLINSKEHQEGVDTRGSRYIQDKQNLYTYYKGQLSEEKTLIDNALLVKCATITSIHKAGKLACLRHTITMMGLILKTPVIGSIHSQNMAIGLQQVMKEN